MWDRINEFVLFGGRVSAGLSRDEAALFRRFLRARSYISEYDLDLLPPAPAAETRRNRTEILRLVSSRQFLPILEKAEQSLFQAEAQQEIRDAALAEEAAAKWTENARIATERRRAAEASEYSRSEAARNPHLWNQAPSPTPAARDPGAAPTSVEPTAAEGKEAGEMSRLSRADDKPADRSKSASAFPIAQPALSKDVRKLAEIDAYYENELNVLEVPLAQVATALPRKELNQLRSEFVKEATGEKSDKDETFRQFFFKEVHNSIFGKRFDAGLAGAVLTRTLRDFPAGHRAILRLADILRHKGHLTPAEVYSVHLSMIWNDGKSKLSVPKQVATPMENKAFRVVVTKMIETRFGSPESVSELVQSKCREVLETSTDAEEKAMLHHSLYIGTRWLTPSAIGPLVPNGVTDQALRLGKFADGNELFYDRRESLVTIAPPGTGKTTAHVMRNLLYLNGPAVVLDIKGEMHAATANWRDRNVGTVYRFAPNDRDNSLHFNPLDFISMDPDEAFEESERLAELLAVPSADDKYFDNRAIELIRALVLYVALTRTGTARSMETVLDLLSGINTDPLAMERAGDPDDQNAGLNALISRMMLHDMPTLRRMGSALNKMPVPQREGVFDSARSKLKVWESPAIARLTKRTTFRPELLRSERATLYLCVDLGDIKRFASVLRVLLGSCIGVLCKGTPDPATETVTFFLDELPRLKRMDVVEEALDVGRGFGVRLWMFAQNFGQLASSYPNAEGMIGNCLAQCYMNPDAERSKWLSEHLGVRRGLLDGSERPLAEAYDLTGPAYADKVVVMLAGMDNALLTKQPYFQDSVALERVARPVMRPVDSPQASEPVE